MIKRFWTWLNKLSDRKLKETYLKEHHTCLKCRHCKTWEHQMEKPSNISSFGHPMAVVMTCGQCDQRSYWICEAGFWINATEFGCSVDGLERDYHLHQVQKQLDKPAKILVLSIQRGKRFAPEFYRLGGNLSEGVNFITDDHVAPVQPSNEQMFAKVASIIHSMASKLEFPKNYLGEFLTRKLEDYTEDTQVHLMLVYENNFDFSKAIKQTAIRVKPRPTAGEKND